MAAKRVESLGPTGELVRQRVREARDAHGYSFAELSRRLTDVGRPIPPLGLSRIESGERRIDVDDLVALALVLDVPLVDLLVPNPWGYDIPVEHTGLGELPSAHVRRWLLGSPIGPFFQQNTDADRDIARSYWARESDSPSQLAALVEEESRAVDKYRDRRDRNSAKGDMWRARYYDLMTALAEMNLERAERRFRAAEVRLEGESPDAP